MALRRRSGDPFRPASTTDQIRAGFHFVVASLFTVPMWLVVYRVRDHWEVVENQGLFWLVGLSNAIVWGVPLAVVAYRWREQIYRHPERPRSALVRTYAYAQMVGVLLAVPLLLLFGLRLLWLFF